MINPFSAMTANVKIILAVVALVGVFGAGFYANGLLWEAKYLSLEKTHLEKQLEQEKNRNQQYADAMKRLDNLAFIVETADKSGYEELKNVQRTVNDLSVAYLSVNKRLSVLIQRPSGTAPPSDTSPGMGNGEERADLAPRVAAGLTGLVGRGDQAIIALSTCQVILDAVVKKDDKALQNALDAANKHTQ